MHTKCSKESNKFLLPFVSVLTKPIQPTETGFISQQPLAFIFDINRMALNLTLLMNNDCPLAHMDVDTQRFQCAQGAYRLAYSGLVASAIGRISDIKEPVALPRDLLANIVASILNLQQQEYSEGIEELRNKLHVKSSEEACNVVLKWIYLVQAAQTIKSGDVILKLLLALPKAHLKSIEDYILKTEILSTDSFETFFEEETGNQELSEETLQRLWVAANSSSLKVKFRPIIAQLFELMNHRKDSDSWDLSFFKAVFDSPIEDADGNVFHTCCSQKNSWKEARKGIEANIGVEGIHSASLKEAIRNDVSMKAKEIPLACKVNSRLCQYPVVSFLYDVFQIVKWVKSSFGACTRDAAVMTVFLIEHLAYWNLTFNGKNSKQNSSFPYLKNCDSGQQLLIRSKRLCFFLIHGSRKHVGDKYLHWYFSHFADNFFSDEEIQKYADLKSKTETAIGKKDAYSKFIAACGTRLTRNALNSYRTDTFIHV